MFNYPEIVHVSGADVVPSELSCIIEGSRSRMGGMEGSGVDW